MKVREQLQKKKNKLVAIIYPQIFFLLLLNLWVWDYFSPQEIGYFITGLLVLFFGSVIILYKKVLCPTCSYNFYHLSVRKRKSNKVNYCPGCGLNLDSDSKT